MELLSVALSEPTAGQAQPFSQADGTFQGKIHQGGGLPELLKLICLCLVENSIWGQQSKILALSLQFKGKYFYKAFLINSLDKMINERVVLICFILFYL